MPVVGEYMKVFHSLQSKKSCFTFTAIFFFSLLGKLLLRYIWSQSDSFLQRGFVSNKQKEPWM